MTHFEFKRHHSLKNSTTFGIGGPAEYYIEVHDIETLQALLPFCKKNQLRYFILGKGSNVIFDDRGFQGVVIVNRISFLEKQSEDTWYVGAGYSFSLLGSQTARQGWSGLEFASGIPGSVGGAIFMNAGANGNETSQSLLSVTFVNDDGELHHLPINELEFKYRYSSFQNMSGAIVGATFRLVRSNEARGKQLDIIHYRKNTQPYNDKSAGCIFRNPACHNAGALIEKVGLKGKTIGGAQVSHKHANFIINKENASSADVLKLIHSIQQEVKVQTGIELEHEVLFISHDRQNKG